MTCPRCGSDSPPCEACPVVYHGADGTVEVWTPPPDDGVPWDASEGCAWCGGTGTMNLTTGRVTAYLRPSSVACPRCNQKG